MTRSQPCKERNKLILLSSQAIQNSCLMAYENKVVGSLAAIAALHTTFVKLAKYYFIKVSGRLIIK